MNWESTERKQRERNEGGKKDGRKVLKLLKRMICEVERKRNYRKETEK